MLFRGKPLTDLTEVDLALLIEERVGEARWIDYKRQLPELKQAAPEVRGQKTREWLADITSFANSSGGFIVYSAEADGIYPKTFSGVSSATFENEMNRLLQLANEWIEPPIAGLTYKAVPLQNGSHVIVLGVPKSWSSPHIVWFERDGRFWARSSDNKIQMPLTEIRAAFLGAEAATERLSKFRDMRLGRILSDSLPIKLEGDSRLVLHLLPLSAFTAQTRLDLPTISGSLGTDFRPLSSFDGYICTAACQNWFKRYRLFQV